jgi:hypothetical protein
MGAFMLYEVGQIVFLLVRNELKIIPARVVEQVIRKRFNEDTDTSYIVELPDRDRTTINVNELDADVFTNIEVLRTHMVDNAMGTIDKLLSNAKVHADRAFVRAPDPVQQDDKGL